jgi:plasmid stability protein
MASVTVKNIPDDLYEQSKQAANAHHRSVNGELIYCLDTDEINAARNEGRE